MKNNNEIAVLGIIFLLGFFASNAKAATAIGGYDLHAAFADPQYYAGSGDHAIALDDGHDYLFAPGSGALVEYDDGTALLTGLVYSASVATRGYSIEIMLQGRTHSAPLNSPKKS